MNIVFNTEKLLQLLKDFHLATGLRMVFMIARSKKSSLIRFATATFARLYVHREDGSIVVNAVIGRHFLMQGVPARGIYISKSII